MRKSNSNSKKNNLIGKLSVIIPTYNRANDLKETIDSLYPDINELNEVLVIDQSNDDSVKRVVMKMKNNKIKYIKSTIPSLTKARNLGVLKASKKSKLICFIDDDVTLDKKYFKEILKVFEDKNAIGVSGHYFPDKKQNKIENLLRRIFFLENWEYNKARVLSAYGPTYPYSLDKTIESQWLPGFNMIFKKKVFDNEKFDENLSGYALAEDFDFSYRVYKKYGNLYITPKAKIVHRISKVERCPTEKIAYMNQINHFYLNFKNFNKVLKERLIFIWCVLGIFGLRIIYFLKTREKKDKLKLVFFFKSLIYCIKNINKIKNGEIKKLYIDLKLI